jgi:tetratricopeptide (TPR) repeat protein
VAVWLHELYASAGRYWDALLPDALGEYLVGMVGVEFGGLLDDLAGYVNRYQAEHMLTVLCGALTRFSALNDNVVRYVVSRPRPMAFAAIEVAVRGDHPALTDALDRLAASSSVDARLIEDLLEDTPRSTITLARWAVRLATQLVDSRGSAPGSGSETDVIALAEAEYQLAFRLAQLGRHSEALTHAIESVRLHRAAVGQHGAEPDGLAESLLVQAARLAKLGRRAEAVDVAREAVRLCRTLDGERGVLDDRVRLAHALHHQAMWLHDIGDHAGAVSIGEEALHIRAQLVDASPRFRAAHAISSMNYACYLHEAGRTVDGLPHARAAVDAYRALAEESPDAYRAALGLALTNLATLLAAFDELEEALTRAEQAVSSYRQVVRPGIADPLLEQFVIAIANYGRRLVAAGRPCPAIDAFIEAEELCLRLSRSGSPAAANRLATIRNDLRVVRRLAAEHPAAE